MGIFSIFVISTVHYQPTKQKISGYNESLISKIHYNQIKEGYNEREKYKTQSKLYYFKT
ncbi:ErmCL family antibiotic resistance leader peptide [Staphylococcus aureus]|nr:ErmCL family antibiotic resistance leader peptide [Staphylococcus aureus]